MHPRDCPSWEYSNHQDRDRILPSRCTSVLVMLRNGHADTQAVSADSRAVHGLLFNGLTPVECPYYAGHYRGEPYRCLQFYNVAIPSDPRVGERSEAVEGAMQCIADVVQSGISALDAANLLPDAQVPRWQKQYYLVTFACRVFVEFLRVHPYANGNGHIGRFLIWGLLGRYGLWPRKWPLDSRPPDPPYSNLISEYRSGNREPLEMFVLKCVLGD